MENNPMKIAAAQLKPVFQDTEANIQSHLRYIDEASKEGVSLIVFPEMSLTGYERELASAMAFEEDDIRLAIFRERAKKYKMLIIAGAPIRIEAQLHIGLFVCTPEGTLRIYTKQYLHTGEEDFFAPSFKHNPLLVHGREKISLAICADIGNPKHPEAAAESETSLYVASIFYSPEGIEKGYEQLGSYAKKHKMQVLMANYAGRSYGMESAGRSAYWNSKGELMGQLNSSEEGLLIVTITEKETKTHAHIWK